MEAWEEKCKGPAEEAEEEEEMMKMEQFYALLRRVRAAKDRLISTDYSSECKKKKKLNDDVGKPDPCPWVPSFQLEDFSQKIEFKNPPIFGSQSRENQKTEKDQTLDLNLSL